jgi:hypothetical protein
MDEIHVSSFKVVSQEFPEEEVIHQMNHSYATSGTGNMGTC